MKRLAALLLAIAAVVWVRRIGGTATLGSAGTALALGFTLVGAWIAGDALRRFQLPRLTGYLLFGVLAGPYLGNLITELMASQLQVITGIATTLIALIAGLTLNFERLGRRLTSIAHMTVVDDRGRRSSGSIAFAWLAWPWLGLAPDAAGLQRLAMILLLVTIVVSFSPTMTAAVTAETGARGKLSELVLTMVLVADLVLLVLFSVAMQLARVVFGTEGAEVNAAARFAWEIGGAIAFGALVGALFALYVRYVGARGHAGADRRVRAAQPGRHHAEVRAAAGGRHRGAGHRESSRAAGRRAEGRGATRRAAGSASCSSRPSARRCGWTRSRLVGAAASRCRSSGSPSSGSASWRRIARVRDRPRSGDVRMDRADFTGRYHAWLRIDRRQRSFRDWGANVQTLLVALIAIHELVGPIVFRQGLARAGRARRDRAAAAGRRVQPGTVPPQPATATVPSSQHRQRVEWPLRSMR